MTGAVKNCQIAAAAKMAMNMESSIVIPLAIRFSKVGIPRLITPLVNTKNSALGVALWTFASRRLGPLVVPQPSLPWHSAECYSKSFPPAATASGSLSRGLCFVRSLSGISAIAE